MADDLAHIGVLGMRWGHRKSESGGSEGSGGSGRAAKIKDGINRVALGKYQADLIKGGASKKKIAASLVLGRLAKPVLESNLKLKSIKPEHIEKGKKILLTALLGRYQADLITNKASGKKVGASLVLGKLAKPVLESRIKIKPEHLQTGKKIVLSALFGSYQAGLMMDNPRNGKKIGASLVLGKLAKPVLERDQKK